MGLRWEILQGSSCLPLPLLQTHFTGRKRDTRPRRPCLRSHIGLWGLPALQRAAVHRPAPPAVGPEPALFWGCWGSPSLSMGKYFHPLHLGAEVKSGMWGQEADDRNLPSS